MCSLIFISLAVICLLVCLKGSDIKLKKREIMIDRKDSMARRGSQELVDDKSKDGVVGARTVMIRSPTDADAYENADEDADALAVRDSSDINHLDLVVARIDFDDGFLNFRKGDRVQVSLFFFVLFFFLYYTLIG